jgi:uncharacterized protein (DUF2252 family)
MFKAHPSRRELYAMGKSLRVKTPRNSHADWKRAKERPDPVRLLMESSKGRIQNLIPIRYGRMLQSPFSYYRGTALNMAADLATTPVSGLRVQACGDSHLCNFGAFATPERRVIADINDLDETLPAPWEWDLKRLAASFVIASRHNGHRESDGREAVLACVRSYRESMAEFSEMRVLERWYASVDMEKLIPELKDKESRLRAKKRLAKARHRAEEHDAPQLMTHTGETPTVQEHRPLIYHPAKMRRRDFSEKFHKAFDRYRQTLPEHVRVILDNFEVMDMAIKVVGVGSVGTECAVLLLMAGEEDPLFLQVKEARPSVLEPYAGKSLFANHGQRVVVGHHLTQSASDRFLGWSTSEDGRHFYVRQLWDMKIKPLVEIFTPSVMQQYAELCGRILARAHACSGDPAKISGYLGKGGKVDEAIADFSALYADQNERDYGEFRKAVRSGKLEAEVERTSP